MTPRNKLATSAYAFNAASLNGFDETDFAAASGSSSYIQNGTSPQTANFNITGTGTAATLQAATFDRANSGTLTVGGTNATAITLADNTSVTGTLGVSSTISASNLSGTNTGNVTLSGQNYLSIVGQAITAAAINLSGSHVTATLAVGNGGTGATTTQGAINAISGLTTNGDLLYHNGTNSTRLARGTNGQCLTSTSTSIQWGSCGTAGASTSLNNLASVAINTSLISDTTNTDDLGSSAITWRSGYFGTALYSPIFDRANSGTLTVGGTNATAITLADNTTVNGNLTVSAGNSLTLTGGNTASRPGSPTEGMVYYDSETKQLLTYANGKWQADRSDAILVAANDSSARDKAAADFVADGTADQTEINNALTAASGKKVVLLAGTYTANATILVPNNTTLSGVGSGTIVQFADIDTADNLIENSDTSTGTGVVVRDLKLDGRNDLNTAGNQTAIYLSGLGDASSGRAGGLISNVITERFRFVSVYFINTDVSKVTESTLSSDVFNEGGVDNVISDNIFPANATRTGVLDLAANGSATITGNVFNGRSTAVMGLYSGSRYVISGNRFINNTEGVYNEYTEMSITGNQFIGGARAIEFPPYSGTVRPSNITGNQFDSQSEYAIWLGGTNYVKVDSNTIKDSGGASTNNGIYLDSADNTRITDNSISDASCTTTCYAINISDSTSDNNYLSGNVFNPGTINDIGTGTTYSNQSSAAGGLDALFKQANSTTAFQIQNASGSSLLTVDTTNSMITMGPTNQQIQFETGAGNHGIELGRTDGTSSTPYIDFHSATSASSYDVRLIASGGNGTAGNGVLNVTAAELNVNGRIVVDFSSTATVNGVCHSGADIDTTGVERTLVACSNTPNDYAEFYPTDGNVDHGELVATTPNLLTYEAEGADAETGIIESMGTKQISILKRAQAGDNVLGIVSTAPFQTIGKDIPVSANRMPIALSGRVPLKVTNENGAIGVGDKLTISSEVAGHATKAVAAGNTYAVALEPMNDDTGTILVYVDNNYYAPPIQNAMNTGEDAVLGSMNIAGSINVMGDASFVNLTVAGDLTVSGDTLLVGTVTTGDIYVQGHIMTRGNTPDIMAGAALGSNSQLAEIDGTDTAGTITMTAGNADVADGVLAEVTFDKAYDGDYKVVVSAQDENAAQIRVYVERVDGGFVLKSLDTVTVGTEYSFDYLVQGIAND